MYPQVACIANGWQRLLGELERYPAAWDPRVVDLFNDGRTIEPALPEIGEGAPDDAPGTQGAVEDAVLELLTGERPAGDEKLSR